MAMRKPVKVINDGTIQGTKVLLPDGTDIAKYCRSIIWKQEPPDFVPTLTVEFIPFAEAEVEG